MIPGWMRRKNETEANAYAKRADALVGKTHARTAGRPARTHSQVVPERVRGYALRLRLWAADVARSLRP